MNAVTKEWGIQSCVVLVVATFVGFFLTVQRCQSLTVYTIGDMSSWISGYALSGFDVDSGGGDYSAGQTFRVDNGNALVNSISFPVQSDGGTHQFQVGVAAWNGARATGSWLYLSAPLTESGNSFESFTVTPNNLILSQSREYMLVLTPNAFVNTSGAFNTAVGYVPSGGYTEGQFFFVAGYGLSVNDLLTQTWTGTPANMAFSINYQLAPVPEPVTLALAGLSGLASMVVARRRK
jgi:hypothetical protein